MKNTLSLDDIAKFDKNYSSNKDYLVSERAVTKNGIDASCVDDALKNQVNPTFSVEINAGTITNQQKSGRCWMFSGLNVIRTALINKFEVKNLELSQAFLQFYDKLEKANFFLEKMIALANEDYDSRHNVFMIDTAFMDGGHWAMFVNLVKKYGICPSQFMPDSIVSSNTSELNSTLTTLLTKDASILRKAVKAKKEQSEIENMKSDMLNEVYRILAISLGLPPKSFTLEYKDKNDKFARLPQMTPVEFFKTYITIDLDDYISLCDSPLISWKKMASYTCPYVNNMVNGEPVVFFNCGIEPMKKAVINSLKDHEPVFFSSDVLSQSIRKEGVLANGILKREELFHVNLTADKQTRVSYRSSFCNHAMTFTGVNLDDNGNPNRYKVENSWGKDNGTDGFFVMDDAWFDNYVFQVLVNKKYIDQDIVKTYEKNKLIEVEPFNTMWMNLD
ncbi:MAG: C1 family peptidase [Bacilli bacterium]|jgi:bleomycin hydrolase